MKKFFNSICIKFQKLIDTQLEDRWAFVFFSIAAFFFILPILFANVDYVDDLARRTTGYYDWGSLGRFLTEIIMKVVTFSNSGMADVGHFMQILSILPLAATGFIVSKSIAQKSKVCLAEILVCLVLVLNPLLLANLSFRFDSFSMILAYSLSVVAAVVCVNAKSYRSFIVVAILLFMSISLYQAMVLVFLPVIIALFTHKFLDNSRESLLKQLLSTVVVFIGVILLYYIVLKLGSFSSVGIGSRGILQPLNLEGVRGVIHNFKNAWITIYSFISPQAIQIIIIGTLICTASILVWLVVKKLVVSKEKLNAGTVLVLLVILPFTVLGPFALMNSALIYQVRTLSVAAGILFMAFIVLLYLSRKNKYSKFLLIIPIVWILYTLGFAYSYGSALSAQREYDRMVYDEIDDYLLNDDSTKNAGTIYIGGSATSPLSVVNTINKRQALKYMDIGGDNAIWYIFTSLINSNSVNASVQWYTYSPDQEEARSILCEKVQNTPLVEKRYFTVYKSQDKILYIWLKNPSKGSDYCTG